MTELDNFKLCLNLLCSKNKYIDALQSDDILNKEIFDFVIENDQRDYSVHMKAICNSLKIEDDYYFEKFYEKYGSVMLTKEIIHYIIYFGRYNLFMKYCSKHFTKVSYEDLIYYLENCKNIDILKYLCQHFYSKNEQEHYNLVNNCLENMVDDYFPNLKKMLENELIYIIINVANFDYHKLLLFMDDNTYIARYFNNYTNNSELIKMILDKLDIIQDPDKFPYSENKDIYEDIIEYISFIPEKEDTYLFIYNKFKDIITNSYLLFSYSESFTKKIIENSKPEHHKINECLWFATQVSFENLFMLMKFFDVYEIQKINTYFNYFNTYYFNTDKFTKNYIKALYFHKMKYIIMLEERIFGTHNFSICNYVQKLEFYGELFNVSDTCNIRLDFINSKNMQLD